MRVGDVELLPCCCCADEAWCMTCMSSSSQGRCMHASCLNAHTATTHTAHTTHTHTLRQGPQQGAGRARVGLCGQGQAGVSTGALCEQQPEGQHRAVSHTTESAAPRMAVSLTNNLTRLHAAACSLLLPIAAAAAKEGLPAGAQKAAGGGAASQKVADCRQAAAMSERGARQQHVLQGVGKRATEVAGGEALNGWD